MCSHLIHTCLNVVLCLTLKAMAEESGDGDKAKGIQDELNELEERAEALDRQRTKSISAIRFDDQF